MLEELFFAWGGTTIINILTKVILRLRYIRLLSKCGYKPSKVEKSNILLSMFDANLFSAFIPVVNIADMVEEFYIYRAEKHCLLRRLEFDRENNKKQRLEFEENCQKKDTSDNKSADCKLNGLSETEMRKEYLIRLKEIILVYQNQKAANQNLEVETSDKTKKLNFPK